MQAVNIINLQIAEPVMRTKCARMHVGRALAQVERSLWISGIDQDGVIPARDAASVKAAIEGFAAEPNGGLIANPATSAIVPLDELSRLAFMEALFVAD